MARRDRGATADDLAFYDALGGADMAAMMGDGQLLTVAREVARTVRENATIESTLWESVRANMRRMVKRTLNRLGYPPDKRDGAVETVVRQAALFAGEMAAWAIERWLAGKGDLVPRPD